MISDIDWFVDQVAKKIKVMTDFSWRINCEFYKSLIDKQIETVRDEVAAIVSDPFPAERDDEPSDEEADKDEQSDEEAATWDSRSNYLS